jgi:hypothetical protein
LKVIPTAYPNDNNRNGMNNKNPILRIVVPPVINKFIFNTNNNDKERTE